MSTAKRQSYGKKPSKSLLKGSKSLNKVKSKSKSLRKPVKKSIHRLRHRLSLKSGGKRPEKSSSVHSAHKRSSSNVKRRSSSGSVDTAKFWCMRCKNFSKSEVEKYETGAKGGTFAKGHCGKCDTKVCLIVKKQE